MTITLEFSELQQAFHNRYPTESKAIKESGYTDIAEIESEVASEFVFHMNNYYRKKHIHMSLEIVKEKWNSFLSKNKSTSSK